MEIFRSYRVDTDLKQEKKEKEKGNGPLKFDCSLISLKVTKSSTLSSHGICYGREKKTVRGNTFEIKY